MSIKPTILSCMVIMSVFAAPLQAVCCLSPTPLSGQNEAAHACCDSHLSKVTTQSHAPNMRAIVTLKNCTPCNMGPVTHQNHYDNRITPEAPAEPVAGYASPISMAYQLEWSDQVHFSNALSVSIPAPTTLVALNCQFRN